MNLKNIKLFGKKGQKDNGQEGAVVEDSATKPCVKGGLLKSKDDVSFYDIYSLYFYKSGVNANGANIYSLIYKMGDGFISCATGKDFVVENKENLSRLCIGEYYGEIRRYDYRLRFNNLEVGEGIKDLSGKGSLAVCPIGFWKMNECGKMHRNVKIEGVLSYQDNVEVVDVAPIKAYGDGSYYGTTVKGIYDELSTIEFKVASPVEKVARPYKICVTTKCAKNIEKKTNERLNYLAIIMQKAEKDFNDSREKDEKQNAEFKKYLNDRIM